MVNIITYINAWEKARLDNWYNMTNNMINSKNKANIDLANVNLVEFEIYIKTLLINNIKKHIINR